MNLPEPVFVGFFPEVACQLPEGLAGLGVREICSVSNWFAAGPQGWIGQWKHNTICSRFIADRTSLNRSLYQGTLIHGRSKQSFPTYH